MDIPDEWIREMTEEKKTVEKTVDYSEELIKIESRVTFNGYGKNGKGNK